MMKCSSYGLINILEFYAPNIKGYPWDILQKGPYTVKLNEKNWS